MGKAITFRKYISSILCIVMHSEGYKQLFPLSANSQTYRNDLSWKQVKLDGLGPIDNKPSTD